MISVKIEGGREVVQAYGKWSREVERQLQFTVRQHTTRIQSRAKLLAPVDQGLLRSSIDTLFVDDGMTGITYTQLFYAKYVEFGTGVFAVNGAGRQTPWTYFSAKLGHFVTTSGNKPQPFMLPAYNETAPEFRAAVAAILRRETAGP